MKKTPAPYILAAFVIGIIAGYFAFKFKSKSDLTADGSDSTAAKHEFSAAKTDFSAKSLTPNEIAFLQNANKLSGFKLTAHTSGPIDPTLAKTMIADFRTENNASTNINPILTENGVPMNGFVIECATLKAIVNDADNYGVSFYFGKEPNSGAAHRYTLVYMGAKAVSTFDPTRAANDSSNKPYPFINPAATSASQGLVFDYVSPCPDACGDYGN